MLSVMVLWAYDVEIDGIYYNLDETNKSAEVTFGDVIYSDIIVLPSEVSYNNEKYEVTTIGVYAFRDCDKLKEVKIPISVQSIESYAFWNSSITSITIPENVSSISSTAFQSCDYLDTIFWNVRLYKDLSSYNATPFYTVRSNIKSIYFGNQVQRIPQFLCYEMQSLTTVLFSKSISSIAYGAFKFCKSLSSLEIPNNIVKVDAEAFYGCVSLSSVNYKGNIDEWVKINFMNESATPTHYAKNLYINNELLTDVIVFDADTIKNFVFNNCIGIKSVEIGNKVTFIEPSSFEGCSGMESIKWNVIGSPNNSNNSNSPFTKIKDNITSFTFNEDVAHIPDMLCYGMSNLKQIDIPDSVKSIGNKSFKDCKSLELIEIGKSVVTIGKNAFSYCNKLKTITIPNNVTNIEQEAFYGCENLKIVYNHSDLNIIKGSKNCGYIGYYADLVGYEVSGFFYNRQDIIIDYLGDISLTSVELPIVTKGISSGVLSKFSKLISITIGEEVVDLTTEVFDNCYNLKEINVSCDNSNYTSEDGVLYSKEKTEIIKYPAAKSDSSYIIPNSVTSINQNAFSGCKALTSIVWNAKDCADFEHSFYNCDSPFYNIRTNITSFTFGNEVEHIPAYLCCEMSKLKEIIIPRSVTSIGNDAFEGCSGLTSVVWNARNHETFQYDFETPFYNLRSNITSFTFSDDVELIPAYLCYDMSKLTKITIPHNVTSIGKNAFYRCVNLHTVYNYSDLNIVKGSINHGYVGYYADLVGAYVDTDFVYDKQDVIIDYIGDVNLTSVELPVVTKGIKYGVLSRFTDLTSVTISKGVTGLTTDVFLGCDNLKEINVSSENPNYSSEEGVLFNKDKTELVKYPVDKTETSYAILNTVTSIGSDAFSGCSNLVYISIPKDIISVGADAFNNCNNITTIEWNAVSCSDFSSSPFEYIPIDNFTFGNEVQRIPAYLCSGMGELDEITIPKSLTTIGHGAFSGCCDLTKVNYLGSVDKWVEIDFEYFDSNPTKYAKDLYINGELLTDVKISAADSIKNYAFYNCASIKSVEIGNSITSIGDYAFSGCDNLRKVTAYPTTVPNVYENSFAHYNAALYVLCDVYDDYFFDDVFGTFKVTECISAEEVDAPDKVEIEVDEDNNANVIWPSTDGAKKYELEISKDGEVFCTLLFNENGQLTSIDFGNRSASVGFQFTVTGLDGASKYAYSMVAMDKKGNELQSYKGTFTTNGYVPGPGEEDEPTSITETLADANITVSGGTISADTDFTIYNTIGRDVTAQNGSLTPGVYVVKVGDDIAKVMVK